MPKKKSTFDRSKAMMTKVKCECGWYMYEGYDGFLLGVLLCPRCNWNENPSKRLYVDVLIEEELKNNNRGKLNGDRKASNNSIIRKSRVRANCKG